MKAQASVVSEKRAVRQSCVRLRLDVPAAALVWLVVALLAMLLWSAAVASPAEAKLSQVGPADPDTKLPVWIEDEAGLRLQACFARDRCLPLADYGRDLPGGGNTRQYAIYWSARATTPTNGGGSASLLLTTRGSVRSAEGRAYAQQVSSKIHVSVDNLEPGVTYRVTHPYGTETFTNVDGGRRGIDFTEEIGCLQSPCDDFSAALNGRVGPWLTRKNPGAAPPGYIGDSTPHQAVGSPLIDENGKPQNYFKIEGPSVGGPGIDVVQTDLFAVEGKVSGLTAFADPRAGSYDGSQTVTLTASDSEGETFYTTDGTEPTANSTPYKKPIPITENTTLKFIVIGPDDAPGDRARSPVLTETYTVNDLSSG